WRRLRPSPPPPPPQPRLEILDPALTRAPGLEPLEFESAALDEPLREALLAVPRTVAADPEVKSFLAGLDTSSTAAALSSLRKKLSDGGFTYSLRPGRIGRLQIGKFLGETRTGFCEHYAAAAANILRAAGIPARVVAGFRGGSWNPWTQTLTVKALHAHAWVEAWDSESSRWVRFDPTDAVTTELSLRDAAEWSPEKWKIGDRLWKLWEAWVEAAPVAAYGLTSTAAALAVAGLVLAVSLLGRPPADPARRLLESLERKMRTRRELRRRTGEAPLTWMRRVAAAWPGEAAWWEAAAARFERLAYMRPRAEEAPQQAARRA
ncbi:MAG: transglutaminase family protein, partial [Terrimicrobiaceae bacterium]|nr:transglutaminase family protein [Terrimicrobiaceae bacterium]